MSQNSPSKLNSSTESDYHSRNQKYDDRIHELEKELKLIKDTMKSEESEA